MHTTLSSKWHFAALFLLAFLLTGCGVTTKKTFLGEPVARDATSTPPVSSSDSGQAGPDGLSRNPALDSANTTGVQKLLNIITPYRIDIQQGNFVSQEMLEKIQAGMTKEQVRFALGTPLLADVFHSNRWDYLFRLQKANGQITNNRIVIYFDDNRVAKILHDALPNETEYLEIISGPVKKKKTDKSVQPETPVSSEATAVIDATETVESTSPPETYEATPVTTDYQETATTESVEILSSPAETEMPVIETAPVKIDRTVPTMTDSDETVTESTETIESVTTPQETFQTETTVTDSYDKTTVSTESVESTPASSEMESVEMVVPAPVNQHEPKKAATTVTRDAVIEQDDDARAAPNSTMQLHQLMQPQ